MNWDRIKGAIVGACLVLAIMLFAGLVERLIESRMLGDSSGVYVVVMLDDSANSIPQALITDGPIMRALKADGHCTLCSITDEWTKDQGYDALLEHAGGAPAMLILNAGGKCVYSGRLPTDENSLRTVLTRHMGKLPDPLPDSPSDKVVTRGQEMRLFRDTSGREWVDGDEHARMLTCKPPSEQMLAALPQYGSSNPVFPEKEWYNLNRRNIFGGKDWILDQNGYNSCVANGGAGCYRRIRVLAGMKDVKLSPGFLYGWINGGQDEGASVPSILGALEKHGCAPFSLMGQTPFYPRQYKPEAVEEAVHYKLQDGYRCSTWDEAISALLTGRYVIAYGIQVGPTFYKFDQYGVAGHTDGPSNHCMMADGVKKLPDGRIVLDNVNSWGYNFGPWKNGRVYLDKQHLFGGGNRPSIIAMKKSGRDAKDAYCPPVLKP